jgi:hypothetical protein
MTVYFMVFLRKVVLQQTHIQQHNWPPALVLRLLAMPLVGEHTCLPHTHPPPPQQLLSATPLTIHSGCGAIPFFRVSKRVTTPPNKRRLAATPRNIHSGCGAMPLVCKQMCQRPPPKQKVTSSHTTEHSLRLLGIATLLVSPRVNNPPPQNARTHARTHTRTHTQKQN